MKRTTLAAAFILVLVLAGAVYAQTQDVDVDGTVTRVDLAEDGDATLSLELRTRLDTEEERQAFRDLQDRVENDSEAVLANFRPSVERLVERAENSTGRPMAATNFRVDARVDPLPVERGIVTYTLTWQGFARTDGNLTVDTTLAGYILEDGDALVISYPDGYGAESVTPEPESTSTNTVTWTGPLDFAGDEPRLVLRQSGGGADQAPSSYLPLILAALVLLALVAAGGYVLKGGSDEEGADAALSDTDRVMQILEANGGEMKQKEIEEETGWSAAKVSQVTSKLEDEDRIEKLRMGRENVVKAAED